jgi:thiol-disulfide isomerase/thioredoxin
MSSRTRSIGPILLMVAIAGCSGSAVPSVQRPSVSSGSVPATAEHATGAPTITATTSPAAPGWRSIPIADVRSGATLRIVDLAGKVVVVELMATWCPPCLEQQRQLLIAKRQLDPGQIAFVSIDADTRENASTILSYAEEHGFDWVYAVGPPALLRDLADVYGIGVLDPPATPVVVIATDGSADLTETGLKLSDRLVQLIRAAGA